MMYFYFFSSSNDFFPFFHSSKFLSIYLKDMYSWWKIYDSWDRFLSDEKVIYTKFNIDLED